MTTDQGEDVLPSGKGQPAPPVPSYVEGFRPLVPPVGGQSTSQRLQHVFVTNGSPSSFGHVVSKQWRADDADGRSTWAVVRKPLEVQLLAQDLVSGGGTDIPGQGISPQFVTCPSEKDTFPDSGIVVVTFERLVELLSDCLQTDEDEDEDEEEEWEWEWDVMLGNPTFVMNFAWGDMSFEMAFACPLVAGLIDGMIRNSSSQMLMACTVSSDNRPYFGRGWREVKTQQVTALTAGPRAGPNFRGSEEWEGDERNRSFQEIEKLLSEISDEGSQGEGQRTFLLLESTMLSSLPAGTRPTFANTLESLRTPGTARNISPDNKIAYMGQVSGVSDVVIFPYVNGCIDDMGQTVCGADECGVPRSQTEIDYYSRCNQESKAQPRVHVLMSEDNFRRLPAHCETSAAHSQHLTRLLVCCKLIWPDVPLADIPVLLPADEKAVIYQLGNLCAMGIMVRSAELPDEVDRPDSKERQELYRMMSLTSLGRTTAIILKKGVRSLHSAHLLAQLLDTSKEYAALDRNSNAVAEAVVALSILTEIGVRGETHLSRVIALVEGQTGDRSWYKETLRGVAKGKAGRGPMWLALGLWQFLMHNFEFRGPLSRRWDRNKNWPDITLNDGNIYIEVEKSLRWDERLETFGEVCKSLSGMKPVLDLTDTPLTPHELLSVEVALVRAFMDRIMMVEDHGEDFQAWDMASGHKLDRPFRSQEAQVWWENCRRRDALLTGERFPVFCVYSYLCDVPSPDGRTMIRKAVDATYVSARSVRLAFEGTDDYLQVRLPTSNLRLVRESASQASEGGA